MGYGYASYSADGSDYGYGGYYQVVYYGPYFINLADQLSGAGSSAYESLHTVGDTYLHSPTGLYQTSFAYEGQDGSIYQHATTDIGDIQPFSGGTPFYTPASGSPTDSIYKTYISDYSGSGSYTSSDVTTTTYTTNGFSVLNRGPIDHTYSSLETVKDHSGGDYNRNNYSHSSTYYRSGAVETSQLNTYSEIDNGHLVPYSAFETGYRSYTDAYGYTTTSYIDTRHSPT